MIELENVSRIFKVGGQQVLALDRINLQIASGEYCSIMGPSGSGKSTLLNMIGLLDRPTSGICRINTQDISGLADDQLAALRGRTIGFVFQFFHLVPRLTARQNIELPQILASVPPAQRTARSTKILADFGLADRMHHKPDELSGGQCQRVAIARAVINEPSILLADEPTGNLDSKSGIEIIELLETLHEKGLTLIVVTHDPEIGGRAPRCLRFVDGRIAADEQQ